MKVFNVAAASVGRDPAITSKIMAAISSRDTAPEIALRKALYARRFRFRVQYRRVPGRPDIALVSRRVAVFVDGDFWHGNTWRLRGAKSLRSQFKRWRNPDFWVSKITQNKARDRKVDRELRRMGWTVIRIWESEIARDVESCVSRIVTTCEKNEHRTRRPTDLH